MSQIAPGERITELDGLRGLAVLAVVVHHYAMQPFLWVGVDLFFVLSGFLITGILLKQKRTRFGRYLGDFYMRRVRRIVPPYVAFLIVIALLSGVWWLRHWPYLLGAMNFVPDGSELFPPDMGILWSLALEEQFYLLWPLAVYFLSRRALTRLAWALIVVAPILRYLCTPLFATYWAVYTLLPFRMDTLAAGALIALYWTEAHATNKATRRVSLAGVILTMAGFGLAGLAHLTRSANTRFGNTAIYEFSLALSISVLILGLQGYGHRILNSRILAGFGAISYSLYLIHTVTMHRLATHRFLAFGIAIAYAVAMWFIIEAPASPFQGLLRPKKKLAILPADSQAQTAS